MKETTTTVNTKTYEGNEGVTSLEGAPELAKAAEVARGGSDDDHVDEEEVYMLINGRLCRCVQPRPARGRARRR